MNELEQLTARQIQEALAVVLNNGYGTVTIQVVNGQVQLVETSTTWRMTKHSLEKEG